MSRERRPWKYPCEQPKSVLYSSDIQLARNSISPVKMATVSALTNSEGRRQSLSPVKQKKGHLNTSLTHSKLLDDTCESSTEMRVISRAQNWNNSHSPSKVLVTLGDSDTQNINSIKQPSRRAKKQLWTTTVYETRKEREVRDTANGHINKGSVEVRNTNKPEAIYNQTDDLVSHVQTTTVHLNSAIKNAVVQEDAGGYAIPSLPINDHNSPRNSWLEPSSSVTPDRTCSPREQFYTPMTQPKSNYESIASKSHLQDDLMEITKLSIGDEGSSVHPIPPSFSPLNVAGYIGEKTRAKMREFDRVSEKMESSFKHMRKILNQPVLDISMEAQAPEFTDVRHTLPNNDLTKKKVEGMKSRLSLPNKVIDDCCKHLVGISSVEMDGKGDENIERKCNESGISLPKALGARMLAELNYSDKGDKMMYHLHRTEELGNRVTNAISHETSMDSLNAVLNSISLHDSSLVSLQLPIAREDSGRRFQPSIHSDTFESLRKNAPAEDVKEISVQRIIPLDDLAIRKQLVRAHNRMVDRLFKLKRIVLKAKERLCTDDCKLMYLQELGWSFEAELRRRCADALSWIGKPVAQEEFILFVKQHQRRIMMETEEMIMLLKRLMHRLQNKKTTHSTEDSAAKVSRAIKVDTKSLNESVDCDVWNASARTMRVGLNALRHEAEELNRSFEEKNKHLEQRTRESIAVQIQQYDRANKERKSLLSELDNIEMTVENEVVSEGNSAPTPRRLGIEPLDFSLLEVVEDVQVSPDRPMSIVTEHSGLSVEDEAKSTAYRDEISPNAERDIQTEPPEMLVHSDEIHSSIDDTRTLEESNSNSRPLFSFEKEPKHELHEDSIRDITTAESLVKYGEDSLTLQVSNSQCSVPDGSEIQQEVDVTPEISQCEQIKAIDPESLTKPKEILEHSYQPDNAMSDDHHSFNRSELATDLSSSILHAMEEWRKQPE